MLLIFTSGRIVCTGGRSYEDIYFGFGAIYSTLRPYIRFPSKSNNNNNSSSTTTGAPPSLPPLLPEEEEC